MVPTITKAMTLADTMAALQSKPDAIGKYLFLRDLNAADPHLYHTLLFTYTQDILPFIYTPTVGEACEKYHRLPLTPRGLYLTLADKGRVMDKLRAWPQQRVQVIVVTDGERILGLGDLGAGGLGISEGKITLYTAAAGVDPACCLPICLDVGTNNAALLEDPAYKGLRQPRPGRKEYDEFIAEFVGALKEWQPHVLLQWEDFGNNNAFRILEEYEDKICSFNDDIQGTACIALAAVLSALRAPDAKHDADDWKVVFLGAGEAGTGIGELIAHHCAKHLGQTLEQARQRCVFVDSKGLVCASRSDLQHHKQPFAHDLPFQRDLKSVLREVKPRVLVGVSTIANAFDQEVVELMCEWNARPIIMPLSNPTSKSECTFEQAYLWSKGSVLFASGSPFDPITTPDGATHTPAQANNAYIFPAVGHAAVLTQCRSITPEVFLRTAEALSQLAPVSGLKTGDLFPPFSDILDVSAHLMAEVCPYLIETGLGVMPLDKLPATSWKDYCAAKMWRPTSV